MASVSEWKRLKEIITGRNPLKNLKSEDPTCLKNIRNEHGKSLLHVAAKHGSLAVTKYLIEVGLEVNLKDIKKARTPLTYAFIRNDDENKKIVKFLMNSGADVSWTNISSKAQSDVLFENKNNLATVVYTTLKKREGGNQALATYLQTKGWTLDNIACLRNETLTKLALNVDYNLKENYDKLIQAIYQQNVYKFKQILKLVTHSKRIMSWALLFVARTRVPESPMIIKLLLDNGSPINGFLKNETAPLVKALMNRSIQNMWILLDHGANFGSFKVQSESGTLISLQREEEDVRAKGNNCMRLLIEHRGILNCDEDLILLLKKQGSLMHHWSCGFEFYVPAHICTEYLLMQRHLQGQDCSNIADKFHCSDELMKMKNCKIESINLWDILAKSIDEMIPFTKNNSFMNKINSEDVLKIFPRYGKTLQFKVNKALEKRSMIEHTINILSKCLPKIGSCYPILEEIVSYIGVPNLLSLK